MNEISFIRKTVFKMTQVKFAEVLETSQANVSRWERGVFDPGQEDMRRIRKHALENGLEWNDAWFFEVPEKERVS